MDFQVSAADVKISAMTASATRIPDRVEVTTTITVHNDNDDTRRTCGASSCCRRPPG